MASASTTSSTADLSWRSFERAWGQCEANFCPLSLIFPVLWQCEWCPTSWLVPRPDAAIVYAAGRGLAANGDCVGMSELTMDFRYGRRSPTDFAAGADIPASLTFATPDLADTIRALHWHQLSLEYVAYYAAAIVRFEFGGPYMMMGEADLETTAGRPPMICMYAPGHCLNAYDVRDNQIRIYDNRWSYIDDGQAANLRRLDVDGLDWSYEFWTRRRHARRLLHVDPRCGDRRPADAAVGPAGAGHHLRQQRRGRALHGPGPWRAGDRLRPQRRLHADHTHHATPCGWRRAGPGPSRSRRSACAARAATRCRSTGQPAAPTA